MTPPPRVELSGATVLVTGATGGLGRAIALALADRGSQVIVSGRRESELSALAATIGGRAVVADLALRTGVDHLIAQAAQADIVVANAALPASGLLEDLSRGEIDRMLEINLRAPIMLAKSLAPGMVTRGRGQIVLISSLAGKAASPASSIYSATKFGLRGFGLALRQDLARANVGVSVINPGFIRDAGMFHDTGAQLPPGTGSRTPDDVARAVLRAIDEDRAELDVAPAPLRVGAKVASLAPELAAHVSRRMGAHRLADEMSRTQTDKR
jgi:short-subunit dehydrogenase